MKSNVQSCFYYRQEVKITNGFYRKQVGRIRDMDKCRKNKYNFFGKVYKIYLVELVGISVWVLEENLEEVI